MNVVIFQFKICDKNYDSIHQDVEIQNKIQNINAKDKTIKNMKKPLKGDVCDVAV